MILLQSGCNPHVLNPATSLKIVNNLCLVKALYGCELWTTITKHELLALERAFRFAIKVELAIHLTIGVMFTISV